MRLLLHNPSFQSWTSSFGSKNPGFCCGSPNPPQNPRRFFLVGSPKTPWVLRVHSPSTSLKCCSLEPLSRPLAALRFGLRRGGLRRAAHRPAPRGPAHAARSRLTPGARPSPRENRGRGGGYHVLPFWRLKESPHFLGVYKKTGGNSMIMCSLFGG